MHCNLNRANLDKINIKNVEGAKLRTKIEMRDTKLVDTILCAVISMTILFTS